MPRQNLSCSITQSCVPLATDIGTQIGQITSHRAARLLGSFFPLISPDQLNCLKVFIMRQTNVAVPDFSPVPAPTFTWAAIRFVVSLGALIGVSLLVASL